MLKKASSFKQSQINLSDLQKQQQLQTINNSNGKTNASNGNGNIQDLNKQQSLNKDKFNPSNLVSKFQDTSISSPLGNEVLINPINQINTIDVNQKQSVTNIKLITASVPYSTVRSSTINNNISNNPLNDSFEMLE
jgi:hypothetical protein